MSDDEHLPPIGGPQLTEHTGMRIALALERIADAIERSEMRAAHTSYPPNGGVVYYTRPTP